jgi:hypothetical protein
VGERGGRRPDISGARPPRRGALHAVPASSTRTVMQSAPSAIADTNDGLRAFTFAHVRQP